MRQERDPSASAGLRRRPRILLGLCGAALVISSCGGDDGPPTAAPDTEDSRDSSSTTATTDVTTSEPTAPSETTATTASQAPNGEEARGEEARGEEARGEGTINVRLEPVNGFFIEGFEVGLRFETPDGETIASTLWTDFVESTDNSSLDAFYTSVLGQPVPAGDVVVLATANVGIGPGPVIPDPSGDLDCRIVVSVPADGEVTVEVSFSGDGNCLREIG